MNNNGYNYNQRPGPQGNPNQQPGQQPPMNVQVLQQQLAALSPQEREQILRLHPQLADVLRHARRTQQPQMPQANSPINSAMIPPQMGNFAPTTQGVAGMMNRPQQPPQPQQPQPQSQPQQRAVPNYMGAAHPQMVPQQRNVTPTGLGAVPGRKKSSVVAPTEHVVPPERAATLHYWSERLKREGKEVPLTVKVYEQIIERDHNYQQLMMKESSTPDGSQNRQLLARLVSDLKYYSNLKVARLKTIQDQSAGRLSESIWGEGYQGYGNGYTNRGNTHIILPNQRKSAPRVKERYISQVDLEKQAESVSELVPIRLEFDIERDKFKLSDTFLWDINDRTLTIEAFVGYLLHDYRFKKSSYAELIVQSIKEQLNEYRPMVFPPSNYSRIKSEQKPLADVRIPIKLDITVGNNQLVDQFEWDINNSDNDPEEFATVLCEEMALPGEFVSAIAHSIREQTQMFVKSLYLVGYLFDGSSVEEEEIRRMLKLPINTQNIRRPRYLMADYTPQLMELSLTEMERLDKDKERDARRKRRGQGRSGRRGGPTLPDLTDVPKTYRTPLASTVLPGGIDLGPAADSYIETILDVETPKDQLQALREKMEKDRQERQAMLERQFTAPKVTYSHQYGSSLNVKIDFRRR